MHGKTQSILTQADPEVSEFSSMDESSSSSSRSLSAEDPGFLDQIFKRADSIVRGSTPKSSKRDRANELQFSRLKHNLNKLAIQKAKYSKNLSNLQQQIRAGRCPQSLRYKASPRLNRDEIFNTAFKRLVKQSQSKLLELISQQHERNISVTNSRLGKLYKELEKLFPDKERLAEAKRDIASSIDSSTARRTSVKAKANKHRGLCKTLQFRSPEERPQNVKSVEERKGNKILEKYQRSRFIAANALKHNPAPSRERFTLNIINCLRATKQTLPSANKN